MAAPNLILPPGSAKSLVLRGGRNTGLGPVLRSAHGCECSALSTDHSGIGGSFTQRPIMCGGGWSGSVTKAHGHAHEPRLCRGGHRGPHTGTHLHKAPGEQNTPPKTDCFRSGALGKEPRVSHLGPAPVRYTGVGTSMYILANQNAETI